MSQNALERGRPKFVVPVNQLTKGREKYDDLNYQGISCVSIARYSMEFIKGIPRTAIESFIAKDIFENLGPHICEDPQLVTLCVDAASELSADIVAYVSANYSIQRVDAVEFETVHGNAIIVSSPNEFQHG